MADDDAPGRELRHIIRVYEEIKSVVTRALKINLMAMNAIFLAKRAGQAALGFGVLSNELRRFADDLQRQMSALGDMTYGSVATVTALVKAARVQRLVDRTERELRDSGQLATLEMMRKRLSSDDLAAPLDRLAAVNRRLTQLIADTSQLVEMGSVLARSAKIEAAYGAGFSVPLTQVASDFEHVITDIQQSLVGLTKRHIQESAR